MRKVDSTVARETRYIAGCVLALSAVMQIVFLVLGLWDVSVLLGNLLGAVTAVGNFFLMGLTIQDAVEMDKDGVRRKANQYSVDENGELYLSYYVNYIWNSDGTYSGYTLVDVAGDSDGEGS